MRSDRDSGRELGELDGLYPLGLRELGSQIKQIPVAFAKLFLGQALDPGDGGKRNLTKACLTGANLTGANLSGAILAPEQFTTADLSGAIWPANVPVPAGWTRDPRTGRLKRAKFT
jgi:hypothetical protein